MFATLHSPARILAYPDPLSRGDEGVCRGVVDFFCPELELVIEINGNSHDRENAYEKDRERQQEIEGLGIQFLRFNDLDVKKNMPGVLIIIEQWVEEHTPDPSQEGNYPSPIFPKERAKGE